MATKRKTTKPAGGAGTDPSTAYRFTRTVQADGLKFPAGTSVIEGELPPGTLTSLLGVGALVAVTEDEPEGDPAPEDQAAPADGDNTLTE